MTDTNAKAVEPSEKDPETWVAAKVREIIEDGPDFGLEWGRENIMGLILDKVFTEAQCTLDPDEIAEMSPHIDVHYTTSVMGQLLMDALTVEGDDWSDFRKITWLKIAEYMGPDYAQKLYHAAVFATKVA